MSVRRKNARRFRDVPVKSAGGAERRMTFEFRKGDGLWVCAGGEWLAVDVGPAVDAAVERAERAKAQEPEDPRQGKLFDGV